MANTATHIAPQFSLLNTLAAPFVAFGKVLVAIAETNSRVKKLEYLNSLSDAELARRGLTREAAVRQVFSDYLGV